MKIGFIGLGNMAGAMIGGILRQGFVSPWDIMGSARSTESRERMETEHGIRTSADNREVVKHADVIFLAVKPQMYEGVLKEIAPEVTPGKLFVSIAPGKTLAWLEQQLGEEAKVVRCMPNTPAQVGEGCTGACAGKYVSPEEMDRVLALLRCFGRAEELTETVLDGAVTAVSGSAPAYLFMMLEAMADGAVLQGMTRKTAYEFAAQAMLGSAKMLLETGRHPGELKDMVCSPGGTTIEAVRQLEKYGFRSAILEAMSACAEKSRKM